MAQSKRRLVITTPEIENTKPLRHSEAFGRLLEKIQGRRSDPEKDEKEISEIKQTQDRLKKEEENIKALVEEWRSYGSYPAGTEVNTNEYYTQREQDLISYQANLRRLREVQKQLRSNSKKLYDVLEEERKGLYHMKDQVRDYRMQLDKLKTKTDIESARKAVQIGMKMKSIQTKIAENQPLIDTYRTEFFALSQSKPGMDVPISDLQLLTRDELRTLYNEINPLQTKYAVARALADRLSQNAYSDSDNRAYNYAKRDAANLAREIDVKMAKLRELLYYDVIVVRRATLKEKAGEGNMKAQKEKLKYDKMQQLLDEWKELEGGKGLGDFLRRVTGNESTEDKEERKEKKKLEKEREATRRTIKLKWERAKEELLKLEFKRAKGETVDSEIKEKQQEIKEYIKQMDILKKQANEK